MVTRWSVSIFLLFIYSASSLRVLQITDFHLDVDYSTNGNPQKNCHLNNKIPQFDQEKLGQYGDYMCDSPEALVRWAVAAAKKSVPDPDLILWTGDNTPHVEGYNMEYVLRGMARTTEILFSAFPNIKILPTFGNHDYSPANAFDPSSQLYEKAYENMWKQQIGEENKERFLKGGYYGYKMPGTNQKILVLNTNMYYAANKAYDNFTDKVDPAGQFAYFEGELQKAEGCERASGKQRVQAQDCSSIVHVVAHIGPGAFERTPNITWFRPEYNDRFLSIINRYSKNIKWMIFGHHHTDTFHIVRNDEGDAVNVAWMSPAVTPWFSDLPGAGSNNPSFRLFDVEVTTGEIKDFTTYWVDLRDLNKDGKADVTKEYSMKDLFGLSSLAPSAMDSLVQKFSNDEELFQKYINVNSVGWKPNMPTGDFRLAQLCSLRHADFARYFSCMEGREVNVLPTTSDTKKGSEKQLGILSLILLPALLLL